MAQNFTIGASLLKVAFMLAVTFNPCGDPRGETIPDSFTQPWCHYICVRLRLLVVSLATLFWPQGRKRNFLADHEGSHKCPADLLIASLWLMITPPFLIFTLHLGVWDELTCPLVSCDHWTNCYGQSWVTASPSGSSQSDTFTRYFVCSVCYTN